MFGSDDLVEKYRPSGKGLVIDAAVDVLAVPGAGGGVTLPQQLYSSSTLESHLGCFGLSVNTLRSGGNKYFFGVVSKLVEDSTTVDKVVMLARDGVVADGKLLARNDNIHISNDFVFGQTSKYPNLLFGASINPYRSDAIERLEKNAYRGAVLNRWVPAAMKINPADDNLRAFYLKLVQLELPLMVTVGAGDFIQSGASQFGQPKLLRMPLEMGVNVIISGLGANDSIETVLDVVRLMRSHDNLYADVGRTSTFDSRGILSSMLSRGVSDQFLYSFGAPVSCFPKISPYYEIGAVGPVNSALLLGISNPWDRDVIQKGIIGLPESSYYLAEKLFPIQ